jgi:hypothetical protein
LAATDAAYSSAREGILRVVGLRPRIGEGAFFDVPEIYGVHTGRKMCVEYRTEARKDKEMTGPASIK